MSASSEIIKSIDRMFNKTGRWPRFCLVSQDEWDALLRELDASFSARIKIKTVPIIPPQDWQLYV